MAIISTVVYFGVATHVTNWLESWAPPPCELPKDSLHANATAGTSHCYWPKTAQKKPWTGKQKSNLEHSKCSNKAINWGEIQPFLVPKASKDWDPMTDSVGCPPPSLPVCPRRRWIAWGMGWEELKIILEHTIQKTILWLLILFLEKYGRHFLCVIILISISNTHKTAWLLYVHVRLPLLSSDATRI